MAHWQMIASVADVDMRCWCRSDLGSHMYLGHGNQCECKYVLPSPPPPPCVQICEAFATVGDVLLYGKAVWSDWIRNANPNLNIFMRAKSY